MSDDGVAASQETGEPSSSQGSPTNVKKKAKKKKASPERKANAKSKSSAQAIKVANVCVAARCGQKKTGKATWCSTHRPLHQALEYQSKKAGHLKTHEAIFADAEKAASAFERFEKENPPGQYRKSVVDWLAWGKSFGVRRESSIPSKRRRWTFGTTLATRRIEATAMPKLVLCGRSWISTEKELTRRS